MPLFGSGWMLSGRHRARHGRGESGNKQERQKRTSINTYPPSSPHFPKTHKTPLRQHPTIMFTPFCPRSHAFHQSSVAFPYNYSFAKAQTVHSATPPVNPHVLIPFRFQLLEAPVVLIWTGACAMAGEGGVRSRTLAEVFARSTN